MRENAGKLVSMAHNENSAGAPAGTTIPAGQTPPQAHTQLKRGLTSAQVSMIGLSGALGTGLFWARAPLLALRARQLFLRI